MTMHKTQLMRDIEAKYGGDIRDIITDFREVDGGNSWRTVAAILDIGENTLYEWRERLGMPIDGEYQLDPSSLDGGVASNSLDHRAQDRGFEDARDAVLELRLVRGLTRREAAEVLDCHPQTITRHTPEHLRWLIRNHRDVRHERVPNGDHPWRGQFKAIFQ